MTQKLLIIIMAAVLLGGSFMGVQLAAKTKKIYRLEEDKAALVAEDLVKARQLVSKDSLLRVVRADSSNLQQLHKQQVEQLQTVIQQVRLARKQEVEGLVRQVDLLKQGVIVRTIRISTHKPCLGKLRIDSTFTETVGY